MSLEAMIKQLKRITRMPKVKVRKEDTFHLEIPKGFESRREGNGWALVKKESKRKKK